MTRTRQSLAPLLCTALAVSLASPAAAIEFRPIDGSWPGTEAHGGATGAQLRRLAPAAYADQTAAPRGSEPLSGLPGPRAVSNAVSAQSGPAPNPYGLSDWIWQWGQFISHDIDLTPTATPAEPFDVTVPVGDSFFDPGNTGMQSIAFDRSSFDPATGDVPGNPRQQVNLLTAHIDASVVYGSDPVRAGALRTGMHGRLATSAAANGETLLPMNTLKLPNDGGADDAGLFLAGDVRANEQIGLTATHTLFVREHNRLATEIKYRLDDGDAVLVALRDAAISDASNGVMDEDDFIYESARKVVGAQLQQITYDEFLPLLLGPGALAPFVDHDPAVNPGIANEFSTAAYRFGHSMLSPQLKRRDGAGNTLEPVPLREGFFNPDLLIADGIDTVLAGLSYQQAQSLDTLIVDDVRSFLFGPPGAGGFDLASLNIQRGRDHGLPSLNAFREFRGLSKHADFEALTGENNADLAAAFDFVYESVDDVDLWIGGLAEVAVNGGLLGETFHAIVADQFLRLRDGDPMFYLRELDDLLTIDPHFLDTRLMDIIMRNTAQATRTASAFVIASVPAPGTLGLAGLALAFAFARCVRLR